MNVTRVSIEQFAQDHWTTLLYLEHCAVDHNGKIDPRRMRTFRYGANNYHTRLKGGEIVEDEQHDDWECAADLQDAGLIEPPQNRERWNWTCADTKATRFSYSELTNDGERVKLTARGHFIASLLRQWKAQGNPTRLFTA